MSKIARFLRVLPRGKAWWVTAYLIKVSPPIEYMTTETYRKGRLLHNPVRGFPRRLRFDRKTGGERSWSKVDPIYSHSYKKRSTAFVVASASNLKDMMEESRLAMVKTGKEERAHYLALHRDDPARAIGLAKAEDLIKLFQRQDRFEVETYLFPAHKNGRIKDFGELPGSQRGTMDHRTPLIDIGYEPIGFPLSPLVIKAEVKL